MVTVCFHPQKSFGSACCWYPVDGPVVAESVPYAVPDVGLKCPVHHLKLNNCFSDFSSTL